MNKHSFLMLLGGFVSGVSLTWGYLNFFAAAPEKFVITDVEHQQPSIVQHKKNDAAKATDNTHSVVANNVAASKKVDDVDSNISAASSVDELSLEAQVVELKKQLAEQKTTMNRVLKELRPPSDVEAALQAQFDEQIRNEEWAYQTETALQDFLLTADLASMPDIVSAECKTSVCKFKLAAPTDKDSFDHTHWRELNDKLMKQAFWLQFKRTASTSSDTELTILMTTEL
ncbi:hypothetical protein [Pseudoalteromonas sp.]|uniref:hypothetical protein n=1 Tax=Pseudoalteromonas sp. TaxID=53249 RepID=UPI001BD04673